MKNKFKKNRGFSLVELIIVIAIMAILAAALAPAVVKYIRKAKKTNDIDAANEIVKGYQRGILEMNAQQLDTPGVGATTVYVRFDTALNNPGQNLEDFAFEEMGGIPRSKFDRDYYWEIEYDDSTARVSKISLTPGQSPTNGWELYPDPDNFVENGR